MSDEIISTAGLVPGRPLNTLTPEESLVYVATVLIPLIAELVTDAVQLDLDGAKQEVRERLPRSAPGDRLAMQFTIQVISAIQTFHDALKVRAAE